MNNTKNEVINSILFLAELYGNGKAYDWLINVWTNVPTLVDLMIKDLFVNKFSHYNCSSIEYKEYEILLEYSIELRDNGFVTFNN